MFKDLRPLAGVFLHYIFDDFRRAGQDHSQPVEEFGHGPVGFGDHAQPDFAAAFDRQDHVHAAHGGDFFEKLAGASAQAFASHPHLQGSPQRQCQKADQDVGFNPAGFLMKDRPQPQIALAGAKGGLGLLELNIPMPERAWIALRAVGAK